MDKYRSKIGLELVVPMGLTFGVVMLVAMINGANWIVLAILAPIILFIAHLFLSTYYTIHQHELRIKCGFLFDQTINIGEIRKISESNNPISSPAISMDRLEIKYGKNQTVYISPKRKAAFIEDILKLNPTIEVRYKKEKG